jgi:STE24 endopeptidase
VGLVVAAVGLVAFVVLAALLVPWDPVPGGRLTPVPASSVLSAAEIQRAEDYSTAARVWSWSSLAVSLVVACVLGFTAYGARLVERVRGPWWWRSLVAVAGCLLLGRLLTLPLAVMGRRNSREYGLTTQSWPAYAVDLLKNEAVQVVVTALGVLVVVGLARRLPRLWPAVTGGLLAVLVLLGSFVYPLVVEPLFNSFDSLPDGSLRTQVLALADEEGVEVDDVLVADASRRTTTLNAYVSGFGSSRRVVLYDNLVDDVDDREVLSVVAHELAHAKHDDVLLGSALGAAGAAVGIGLLAVLLGGGAADPRRVPRVLALLAVAMFLVSPVENGISRHIETRADVAALRYTDDPEAFIAVQTALSRASLADPTPPAWSQFWFGSHPLAMERVALAQRVAEASASGAAAGLDGAEHLVAVGLEEPVGASTEREDRDGDHRRDAGNQEAVLDCGGPPLVAALVHRHLTRPCVEVERGAMTVVMAPR